MKPVRLLLCFPRIIIVCVIVVLLVSCDNKIESIHYGQDECAFCTMKINNDKYSAMIVTAEGELYKFGSIECLTDFALVKDYVDDTEQSFIISDYYSPGNFIDARKSFYVHNNNFPSPMGLNVLAFDSKEMAEKFINENDGKQINWIDVIDLVRKRNE
jgi:copper chaperone NosL